MRAAGKVSRWLRQGRFLSIIHSLKYLKLILHLCSTLLDYQHRCIENRRFLHEESRRAVRERIRLRLRKKAFSTSKRVVHFDQCIVFYFCRLSVPAFSVAEDQTLTRFQHWQASFSEIYENNIFYYTWSRAAVREARLL